MTLRFWTDPRDRRHWKVSGRTGRVLVFESEDDVFSVVVDFIVLADRSDEDLQRLLDEGKASS